MGDVRITQLDGKLPNLALMRISQWHRNQGDSIHFTRSPYRDLFEPKQYDAVYGSAIFAFSNKRVERFIAEFPNATIGGTGTASTETVEGVLPAASGYDYSIYPDYKPSIGFTQRGCRLACKFCVVPAKEGKPSFAGSIADIWRGPGHPKKIHLLDNDFFGQNGWQERIEEIRGGGFKVCLNQGINVRLIDDTAAAALASIEYRDDQFKQRRLYTAWDNLKDEGVFMQGIDTLERHGIPPKNVMAYMLIGYDKRETWERIWHRFNAMVERGVMPYPMVYGRSRADLVCFQRWVLTGLYRIVPWGDYRRSTKSRDSVEAWSAMNG